MIHEILSRVFELKKKQFIKDSFQLKKTQLDRLDSIYKSLLKTKQYSYLTKPSELLSRPVSDYADFEVLIEQQLATGQSILCPDLVRVEYTSGSTKNKKRILYSKQFLSELNEASTVWMADLYSRFPGIKAGPHYWTLSWSPGQDTDDSELFPWIQRFFLQRVLLLNQRIKSTPTLESSWFATLVNLVACRKLSLISIWSPTLLMRIQRDIQSQATNIYKTLKESKWALFSQELAPLLPVPRFDGKIEELDLSAFKIDKIWPNLSLISAWDSASSQSYYEELQAQFPKLTFQGKGLWATEGVVTIPFQGKKVLAFKSHYYEFKCAQTGKILPSWSLEKDQIVEPIITSANGLTRYLLEDRIQVSDFYNQVPCFEFLGRNATSDLVGEKLTDLDFQVIQTNVMKLFPIKRVLFFAVKSRRPFYFGLCEMDSGSEVTLKSIIEFVEKSLLEHYNYKVARQLQQLEMPQIRSSKDLTVCLDVLMKTYSAQGQFKLQSLYRINEDVYNQIIS